jgi:hypothetical protein
MNNSTTAESVCMSVMAALAIVAVLVIDFCLAAGFTIGR